MKTNTWIDKLLIAPALLISLFVVLIPGILTVVVSLTDWNGIKPELNFIGFRNFQELFADKYFWRSMTNNIKWTLLFLTIPVLIGLITSVFLFQIKKGRTAFQLMYLFPYVLAPVTNAMLWLNIIYNPRSGIFGYLKSIGWSIASRSDPHR